MKINNQLSGKTCEGPAILPHWQVNKRVCHGENSLRDPGSRDQGLDVRLHWMNVSWNAADLFVVYGSRVNYLQLLFGDHSKLISALGPLHLFQFFLDNSSLRSSGVSSQFIIVCCHFLKEDFSWEYLV